MASTGSRSAFWLGLSHGAPFVLVIVPFAVLFGVVGSEAGLNLAEVMGFSVLVIAGASQFAALQLMTDNAPTVIVLATALAVNLRMAMYSASLVPHLGAAPLWKRALIAYLLVDQSYTVGHARFEKHPELPLSEKITYYFGVVTPVFPLWYGFTLVGALVGKSIPPEYALDFALPITFLALVGPALRTLAHVAAAGVSVVLGLALAGLPYNSGLLVAALAAMATGAQVELWMERRVK